MTRSNRCKVCKSWPQAMIGTGYCFKCWPGGPVIPPPCRNCGSKENYYTTGLCVLCHPRAPQKVSSCLDCLAWGAERRGAWRCKTCHYWREMYPVAECATCVREVPVHTEGGCRLCRKQRRLSRTKSRRPSIEESNRYGQQLFFANMDRSVGSKGGYKKKGPEFPVLPEIRPVIHRQLVLFEHPIDIETGFRRGFAPPKDPLLAAALHEFVREHARKHGWSDPIHEGVQRGVRILLGLQDTAGGPIRASDVMLLSQIRISARSTLDILKAAGMVEEDRVPPVVRWFNLQLNVLPEEMQNELRVWFDVWRNGSTTSPRFRPRADNTIASQFRFALPALREWAKTHRSLREISREDVYAVLPPNGSPRSCMLQGLRAIFRVLKARHLVFVNPTSHMSVPAPNRPIPKPVDLAALRAVLVSEDPDRAALAALLAFHAIRIWQLRELLLTDYRDGRLRAGDRVILLADAARVRLDAWFEYRLSRWPNTANPHLFIHYRNANTTTAVTPWWISKRLGMSAQTIRQDRILDEAHASAGDVRLVCDLFGLSVAGAYRYTSTVGPKGLVEEDVEAIAE